MKEYRIGEFAKYLGVTPDFLKHYEDQGILQPSRSDSGYRYYPFNTTMLVIECIRLRNYGMTLREIREIVATHQISNSQVDRRVSENMIHLQEEIALDTALTEDYRRLLEWKSSLESCDYDWEIRRSEPMVFLPHTDSYDFLEDPRIYEILKSWMSFIPIVKSTMKVERSGKVTWGFIVEERILRQLHLQTNGVLEHIPSRKFFCYKFRAPLSQLVDEGYASPEHPAFRTLRSLNLEPGDAYFRTTLMPADWQRDISYQYGFYAIPIQC